MNKPKAEKILSLLVDLYAAQHNVKVKYHIETNPNKQKEYKKGA